MCRDIPSSPAEQTAQGVLLRMYIEEKGGLGSEGEVVNLSGSLGTTTEAPPS